jgi:hypothetical protein
MVKHFLGHVNIYNITGYHGIEQIAHGYKESRRHIKQEKLFMGLVICRKSF